MTKSIVGTSRIVIVSGDNSPLKILKHLIEDHQGLTVVGEYFSLEQLVSTMDTADPDIILISLEREASRMVLDLISKVRRLSTASIVVHVSSLPESQTIDILKLGVSGMVTDSENRYLDLISAIKKVRLGGVAATDDVLTLMMRTFHRNANPPLSRREIEVLTLISSGHSYSEIANSLFISGKTVKTHIRNIYKALNVNSKSAALKAAGTMRII